ncbi:unnamed protein product [Rhizophagus irregularis]|nr:unnamed protein product [Rhizophagus irregularis]
MISRKLFFFAMVTLFCMIFIELSQTAPLIKRQVGKVAFADFEGFTDEFRREVTINPPGSSPFEVDFPSMTVEDVVGDNLVLKFKEYKIGEAKIKSV